MVSLGLIIVIGEMSAELLQKASGEWGWLSPDPVIPRNQMGGSTPICYNRVNSKLLLRLGMQYVLDVRSDMTVWPLEPVWSKRAYQG